MLTALFADSRGNIFDAPGWEPLAGLATMPAKLCAADLIPLPPGSDLMFLPGRRAMGVQGGKIRVMTGNHRAVAAMLPAGYTRTHIPAYQADLEAPLLPLFGYAAAAWYKGRIYVAAVQSDENAKWDPRRYNTRDLPKRVEKIKHELPDNRLVEHLAHCSIMWHCCTAQNLFYRRWEAGIPVSPVCNADCLGCISLQPSECCPSPQQRIAFTPEPAEIAEIGIFHLSSAQEPIVSFGQGCEGEPALAATAVAAGVRQIRSRTDRGIINMNTNGGYTAGIQEVIDAGVDSLRVSMISARPQTHGAYYRSIYGLDEVRASIAYAKKHGRRVSINMLLLPGLNDHPAEYEAWTNFLGETGVDGVQLRNLNIDPEWFWREIPILDGMPMGVRKFIEALGKDLPNLPFGSFSKYQ